MLKTTLILILLSALVPPFIIVLKGRRIRFISMCLYIVAIVYLIIFRRIINAEGSGVRQINIVPFHSYQLFAQPDIRWQIYQNILLFVPFGFLIPWATERGFVQTLLAGCLFSVGIEVIQYVFCLGFCELDDIIHNTFGTVIGYGYCKLLALFKKRIEKYFQRK